MVYDCFPFFNELDLLEIRLNELNDVVDKFVLVEATRTFQKKPKPLHYEENKARFAPFADKIIHVVVDHYPNFFSKFRVPKSMDYDNHQKEQILQGLTNCQPDDVIIISDLDEIPDPKKIIEYKDQPGVKIFNQVFCCYFVNCVIMHGKKEDNNQHMWLGSVMLNYKDLTTIKTIRKDYRNEEKSKQYTIIDNAGWHFSYLGGIDKIISKIESLAHPEVNKAQYKDRERIQELIANGKDIFGRNMEHKFVALDESFPQFILQNQEKYSEFIYNV
ncbi:hypothetical protein BKI52_42060 [marine bacterium AO1-C]|nr:hypothetical protein BKI52_42060 [marine bacterium AO1-C]